MMHLEEIMEVRNTRAISLDAAPGGRSAGRRLTASMKEPVVPGQAALPWHRGLDEKIPYLDGLPNPLILLRQLASSARPVEIQPTQAASSSAMILGRRVSVPKAPGGEDPRTILEKFSSMVFTFMTPPLGNLSSRFFPRHGVFHDI